MIFQSHVPNFSDSEPVINKQEFSSFEELLNHPWIKGWNQPPKEEFHYCWDYNNGRWSKAVLMAEWKEKHKKTWWVLGYMDEVPKDLQKWEPPND